MLALWTGRYGYIFGTTQRTTYWNLVPTGEVFALAVCYVDNFWETQLLWPIFEQLVQALWTGRYEYFFGTFQRTTYWNLVPTGEVFALVVVCGQLLGNVSTLADFRTVGASTLNRTLRNFLWNISKNNILEFGIYWRSICVGSVLFGQNFVTTISLAVFWIVRASHLLRARWIFLWNIPKNNIMKFGAYLYSIYPGSVLGGHFWGNAIC